MYDVDRASQTLGFALNTAGSGHAEVSMTVREDQCNGLGVCHGGLIFTLADTAMAFATNADGSGAFATNAEIDFINPARSGDTLLARCKTAVERGKLRVNDVEVHTAEGVMIAVFRGRTLATGAPLKAATPASGSA